MSIDIEAAKQQICEIGRRIDRHQFAAAHDGNISVRIGEDRFLCTPTQVAKGDLRPEDIATIDGEGQQIEGSRRRSSEALLHLRIYHQRPDIHSVVHCHPPHATAFGIAREPVPQCVLPEVEFFLGEIPISPYQTPGTEAFARSIDPFVAHANAIILANHGTVTYAADLQQAYWWTEVLESYCRILLLAKQMGGISYLSVEQSRELLEMKRQWGFDDPRHLDAFAEVDIRNHPVFGEISRRDGFVAKAFRPPPPASASDEEKAVKSDDEQQSVVSSMPNVVRLDPDQMRQMIDEITEAVVRRLSDR